MQQAGMAAQTCLGPKDVMTGVSVMFFFQGLGGSVFISISQTIFTHGLIKYLGDSVGVSSSAIVHTGATELRDLVPEQFLGAVLVAYNRALRDTFKVGVACACATILAGLTMEWKSVKGLKQGGAQVPIAKETEKEKNGGQVHVDDGAVTDTETVVDSPPFEHDGSVKARDG